MMRIEFETTFLDSDIVSESYRDVMVLNNLGYFSGPRFIQGHPQIHAKFKTSLGYMGPSLKQQQQRKIKTGSQLFAYFKG